LEILLNKYSNEFRASIQPFKYSIQNKKNNKFDPNNKLIRESLLEHVGTLPILAVFFIVI
jgi:hypothetical protein